MRKLLFLLALFVAGNAPAADVLIYGPSLAPANCGGAAVKSGGQIHGQKGLCKGLKGPPLLNEQNVAEDEGHNVTVVDAAGWLAMSTAEFAAFDAIVFGDVGCDFSDGEDLNTANSNKNVWTAAVNGNITLNTFDVFWHYYDLSPDQQDDALGLVRNGINYAASGAGTGLYYSNGCRQFAGTAKGGGFRLEFLSPLGNYELILQSSDNIVITEPGHPTMQGLSGVDLSNYDSSTHALILEADSLGTTAEGNDVGIDKGSGQLAPVVVAGTARPNSADIPALGPAGLALLVLTVLGGGIMGLRRRRS